MSIVSSRGLALVALVVASAATATLASSTYTPVGTLPLPPSSTWAPGADGRLWVLGGWSGGTRSILRQDQVNGSTYSVVGSVAAGSNERIEASPDGSRLYLSSNDPAGSTLRWLSLGGLSTSVVTPTNTITPPAGSTWGPSVGFSGSNLFVSALGTRFDGARRPMLYSVNLNTNTPTMVADAGFGFLRSAGMVAVNGNRLAWAPGLEINSGQVLVYDVTALIGSPTPLGIQGIVGTHLRTPDLAVDARGTVLWRAVGTIGSSSTINIWNNPSASLTVPAGLWPFGIHGSFGFRVNPFNNELLSHAATFPYILARFSIPTPGAASALALGALIATRRRR
jgi:hypothetical protein